MRTDFDMTLRKSEMLMGKKIPLTPVEEGDREP
jgi:hypothetical protein